MTQWIKYHRVKYEEEVDIKYMQNRKHLWALFLKNGQLHKNPKCFYTLNFMYKIM